MAGPLAPDAKAPQHKSAHIMCRSWFWGIAGAIACAYFAYLAYIRLVLGLISETRCWRERVFFGLVLLNLAAGFAFSLWTAAPSNYARDSRDVSFVLWILAALASLMTLAHPREVAATKES